MLKSISNEEFNKKVQIKFNNIIDGFNNFKNLTLSSSLQDNEAENKLIKFIEEAVEINGEENSYVDFYYNKLSDEDKIRLYNLLLDEDKIFLNNLKKQSNNENLIYYRLSKESIPFIVRLNTREVLFCTIYFTKEPCTIWGNYNKSFPVFFNEDNIIEKYKIISEKNQLEIK